MGRNSGRHWGDSVAAYGEVSMAAVRRVRPRGATTASPLAAAPGSLCRGHRSSRRDGEPLTIEFVWQPTRPPTGTLMVLWTPMSAGALSPRRAKALSIRPLTEPRPIRRVLIMHGG